MNISCVSFCDFCMKWCVIFCLVQFNLVLKRLFISRLLCVNQFLSFNGSFYHFCLFFFFFPISGWNSLNCTDFLVVLWKCFVHIILLNVLYVWNEKRIKKIVVLLFYIFFNFARLSLIFLWCCIVFVCVCVFFCVSHIEIIWNWVVHSHVFVCWNDLNFCLSLINIHHCYLNVTYFAVVLFCALYV
jgi:hypothetical protein